MPARRTLGTPQITGSTVDEIRRSTEFWLQHLTDHVDQLMGLRGTPAFHADVDFGQNRLMNLPVPSAPSDAVPVSEALTKALDVDQGVRSWDAEGLRLFNVPVGENPFDAVNVQQLQALIAEAIALLTKALTFTIGSVLFAGPLGTISQDNANFFWDDTNNRLGLGNAAPAHSLDITGNARLRHLIGDKTTMPTVAITAAGAGAGATVTVNGSDLTGYITLNTSVADTPLVNSIILTLTFAVAYGGTPEVFVQPANNEAFRLVFGTIWNRRVDCSAASFDIISGDTALPAATATYIFKYLVLQ